MTGSVQGKHRVGVTHPNINRGLSSANEAALGSVRFG
jgi:hypothetical protein